MLKDRWDNTALEDDYNAKLVLRIEELVDDEGPWTILKIVWFPKVLKVGHDLKRYVEE